MEEGCGRLCVSGADTRKTAVGSTSLVGSDAFSGSAVGNADCYETDGQGDKNQRDPTREYPPFKDHHQTEKKAGKNQPREVS